MVLRHRVGLGPITYFLRCALGHYRLILTFALPSDSRTGARALYFYDGAFFYDFFFRKKCLFQDSRGRFYISILSTDNPGLLAHSVFPGCFRASLLNQSLCIFLIVPTIVRFYSTVTLFFEKPTTTEI